MEQSQQNTRGNSLNVPLVKATTYGSSSVTPCTIRDWNNLLNHKLLKTHKKSWQINWIYKTQIQLYLGPNN